MRIVFEGLPGAGKTELALQLADEFDIPLVPEFACLTEDRWRKFNLKQPFYQANDEAKEFVGNLFLEPLVLFDRHYISTLAYSYSLQICFGQDPLTGENYRLTHQWYQQCLAQNKLSKPNIVFFIDVPPKTSIKRKPNAGLIDYVWGQEKSLSIVRAYYNQFFKIEEPSVKVIRFDGQRKKADILSEMKQYLNMLLSGEKNVS
ncbi:MAG: hypothetical protein H6657_32520 [Ardenticatenaceae bacterium]|nr:hypothetical protein [Ardenticatenaceae bacterium]